MRQPGYRPVRHTRPCLPCAILKRVSPPNLVSTALSMSCLVLPAELQSQSESAPHRRR